MRKLAQLLSAAFVVCSAAPPLLSATHLEVLNAIKQKWDSLPGVNRDADNQELLAFVSSNPEFSNSGLDTRCSCIWATFTDGELVVLANNSDLPPPPASAQARLTAAPSETTNSDDRRLPSAHGQVFAQPSAPEVVTATASELPKSNTARLLNARGPDFPNPVPDLRSWLTDQSYSVLSGEAATVEALRTMREIGGDGVFYINAYGARLPPEAGGTFVLSTATEATDATEADPLIQADLQAQPRRLAYIQHKHFWNPFLHRFEVVQLYAITAAFVRTWQNFSDNSFVYIDACDSDLDSDFKQAFFGKNASMYAGWTNPASAVIAPKVGKFFFDRLLGANKVEAEGDGFKQRPFDYAEAEMIDADYHGMNDFPAFVIFTPNGAAGLGDFGLLAPAISFERPIEVNSLAGTLQIGGTFGSDPRPDPDSKVTVGGLDCPVKPDGWNPDAISCDLPRGAAGDVVVTVRKHQSNIARLTKWDSTFRYTLEGDGTLKATSTYHSVFRADIRKIRPVIHSQPLGFPVTTNVNADESGGSYACSGSAVPDAFTTITWTGGGAVPASRVVPAPANSFQMQMTGLSSQPVTITTDHGLGPGCDWTKVVVIPDVGTFTETGHWDLGIPQFDIGMMPIEPNDPSFPADFRSWTDIVCPAPVVLGVPRCRMEWDAIKAMFPPDATSAR